MSQIRERVLVSGVGLLMLSAPLYWASVPPLAHMFIELCSIPVLISLFWANKIWADGLRPSRSFLIGLILLCGYPLVYLLPVPIDAWVALSGTTAREPYVQGLALFSVHPFGAGTISVSPLLTEAYWLSYLPPLAVFMGVMILSDPYRTALAYLAVIMAVFQSLLGLMQYGSPTDSFLCFGTNTCVHSAHGTYFSYDHLAGLFEMILPLAVGLIGANIGKAGHAAPRYQIAWSERLRFWTSLRGHTVAVLSGGCVAMLLGIIFTRSRSGITITMLGILVCLLFFSRRIGTSNKASGVIGTIVVVVMGLALVIGLAPVLQRFSFEDPLHDSRISIFTFALEGIGKFMPLGSGPGTFPAVFRQFQPVNLGNYYVNHAHNDYLEWVFEGGIIAILLAVLLLVVYLRQWIKLISKRPNHSFRFVQYGAGIGLLLLSMHGLTDFNWHIPSNVIYSAFLAGVFLGRPRTKETKMESTNSEDQGMSYSQKIHSAFGIVKPTSSIPNPFEDHAK